MRLARPLGLVDADLDAVPVAVVALLVVGLDVSDAVVLDASSLEAAPAGVALGSVMFHDLHVSECSVRLPLGSVEAYGDS